MTPVLTALKVLTNYDDEFIFYVKSNQTDKGNIIGYHVHDNLTDQRVATFHKKDHGLLKNAQNAAHNLVRLLNRKK